MPSVLGGVLNDLRAWVLEHLQYPAEAVERNIQGRVVVTFTIEKEGSVSNILVLQSPDNLLADEARRVIASSPAGAWTPGEQRGREGAREIYAARRFLPPRQRGQALRTA